MARMGKECEFGGILLAPIGHRPNREDFKVIDPDLNFSLSYTLPGLPPNCRWQLFYFGGDGYVLTLFRDEVEFSESFMSGLNDVIDRLCNQAGVKPIWAF